MKPEIPPGEDGSGFPPTVSNALALRQPYQLSTALEPAREEQAHDDSLTLTDLLRIVAKHKWTLITVVLLALVAATLRTFLATPIYRSTVVLQIDRVAPRVVRFETDTEQAPVGNDEPVALRTQVELLKSRSLAERVIDELRLDRSRSASGTLPGMASYPASAPAVAAEDASAPRPEPDFLERIVTGYRSMVNPAAKSTEALTRDEVLVSFQDAMTVEPVRNSRLVKLHIENTNPELAARIANTMAQSFIAMGLERKLEASSYAKTFLEDQIKQMKAKLEESERNLNRYAQEKQILSLDEKSNVINQTFTDYATALSRAEQERIKAEALAQQMRTNPDAVPQVIENRTIQAFKERKARLEIEYQENLRIFKPDFPKMVQLKSQIDEADLQIRKEVGNVAASIQTTYEAARQQEVQIRAKLEQTRKEVLSTQDRSIDLNLLKREVDTNRQLYDNLLQRLKELGVSGGATTNNISIVDPGESALFPYKPNLLLNLAIGLGAGLLLGLCVVFVLEVLDDSIKFPDEVERTLGVPLMGIIPRMSRKRGEEGSIAMEVHQDPRSTIAEAYRSVRTALQFSTHEGAPKRLVVTSTTRNEGKSTTSLALAINFAQMGQKVLLIDGDMRNPTVHKMLGIPNEHGLSNLLSSDSRGDKLITPTEIPNLSVLTAGPIPPNPVDLLLGPKLLLLLNITSNMGIDYVIVDAPPLLGIADSVVLGNQLQNILYVVQASRTRKSHIKAALRRLRIAGLVPRGVVLTQTLRGSVPQDYESYYGYGAENDAGGKKALADAR